MFASINRDPHTLGLGPSCNHVHLMKPSVSRVHPLEECTKAKTMRVISSLGVLSCFRSLYIIYVLKESKSITNSLLARRYFAKCRHT